MLAAAGGVGGWDGGGGWGLGGGFGHLARFVSICIATSGTFLVGCRLQDDRRIILPQCR